MKKFLAGIGMYTLPFIAAAQLPSEIEGTVDQIANIVNAIIPILIGLAVIYFIWGVISFVIAKGPDDKQKARDTMIYGIIGLFVIVAVWGLIAVLSGALGVQDTGAPTFEVPDVQ